MANVQQISRADFGPYHFSLATPEDNQDIIALLKRNPIHMEMDYIMDRKDDFFMIHRLLEGSKVVIARKRDSGELVGSLSLLKFSGQIGGQNLPFQYVTDLVRSKEEHAGLLMKMLLNFAFEQFFDTDFIFGLINAENKRARFFSVSETLKYPGTVSAELLYYEMVPLAKQRLPKRHTFRIPTSAQEVQNALDFINQHYSQHMLFQPLDAVVLEKMSVGLPGFGPQNIVALYEEGVMKGAMIWYNPSEVVSLIIAKMDRVTRFFLAVVRWIHRMTGLLFDPPEEGAYIKTLQVRYLAGKPADQSLLLQYANNLAYADQLHSVSMLVDAREPVRPKNWIVYRYKSLMYAAHKVPFSGKVELLANAPVFFDITFS